MTEQAAKPAVEYFEITYILGRIERVNADYYSQNGDFINFKTEGGKVIYSVRSDSILSCETIYEGIERFVTTKPFD